MPFPFLGEGKWRLGGCYIERATPAHQESLCRFPLGAPEHSHTHNVVNKNSAARNTSQPPSVCESFWKEKPNQENDGGRDNNIGLPAVSYQILEKN